MLTKTKYTFSNHVRNRADKLANLAEFEHVYTQTLIAIAKIDWHKSNNLAEISDYAAAKLIREVDSYQAILAINLVYDDSTATSYMDQIEGEIRRWIDKYDQLKQHHQEQLNRLAKSFGKPQPDRRITVSSN